MKIITTPLFESELEKSVRYCTQEFGKAATIRFLHTIEEKSNRISSFPYTGRPEPSLAHRSVKYRYFPIDNHRKIIYSIDDENSTIYLADLWDIHMSTAKLIKRI